jgi:hypothetical protein
MERFLLRSPGDLRRAVYEGFRRAYERGDLTMLYHYISFLARDYYGVDLPYEFDYYYKVTLRLLLEFNYLNLLRERVSTYWRLLDLGGVGGGILVSP